MVKFPFISDINLTDGALEVVKSNGMLFARGGQLVFEYEDVETMLVQGHDLDGMADSVRQDRIDAGYARLAETILRAGYTPSADDAMRHAYVEAWNDGEAVQSTVGTLFFIDDSGDRPFYVVLPEDERSLENFQNCRLMGE